MHIEDPRFPPAYDAQSVATPATPVLTAVDGARAGTLGAGDIVWARRVDRAEMAFVFEPDVPAVRLPELRILMHAAIIDALGALMPSQTAIQFRWPDALLCNDAIVGGTAFALPDALGSEGGGAVPDWCVGGIRIDLTRNLDGLEPGIVRDETSLMEEDGGDLDRSQLLQSIASHLLSAIHTWEGEGVRSAVDRWIGRVVGFGKPTVFDEVRLSDGAVQTVSGEIIGVGDDLALLVKSKGGTVMQLDPALVHQVSGEVRG